MKRPKCEVCGTKKKEICYSNFHGKLTCFDCHLLSEDEARILSEKTWGMNGGERNMKAVYILEDFHRGSSPEPKSQKKVS